MVLHTPAFVLTASEADKIQAFHMARLTKLARTLPILKYGAVLIPIAAILAFFALDRLAFGQQMPLWFFVGLMVAFLLGMLTQTAVYTRVSVNTRKRLLESTPQVWEPRVVALADKGITQTLTTSDGSYAWAAVERIEKTDAFILFWLQQHNSIAVPLRVFETSQAADQFRTSAERLKRAASAAPISE